MIWSCSRWNFRKEATNAGIVKETSEKSRRTLHPQLCWSTCLRVFNGFVLLCQLIPILSNWSLLYNLPYLAPYCACQDVFSTLIKPFFAEIAEIMLVDIDSSVPYRIIRFRIRSIQQDGALLVCFARFTLSKLPSIHHFFTSFSLSVVSSSLGSMLNAPRSVTQYIKSGERAVAILADDASFVLRATLNPSPNSFARCSWCRSSHPSVTTIHWRQLVPPRTWSSS